MTCIQEHELLKGNIVKIDLHYRVGWRVGKTVIAVALSMVYVVIFDREAILAPVNAVICTLPTRDESIASAKTRLVSTGIGGALAFAAIQIGSVMPEHPEIWYIAVLPAMVLINMYLCNVLRLKQYITYSTIIILVVALNYNIRNYEPVSYTISRLIDTAVGAVIATLVNIFLPSEGSSEK